MRSKAWNRWPCMQDHLVVYYCSIMQKSMKLRCTHSLHICCLQLNTPCTLASAIIASANLCSKFVLNSFLHSHSHVPRASTCYRAADYSYREESIDKAQASWGCPKCRTAYQPSEVPSEYRCFCGKQRDPPLDPWLAPHTCGDICGRELASGCGHTCVLLCHPGPCPPCPRQVSICPVPFTRTSK